MIVRDRASTADENSVASDYATRPDSPAPIHREESVHVSGCIRHIKNYSVTIARLSTDNHYSEIVHEHSHCSVVVSEHSHYCEVVHEHSHYCEVVHEHSHYCEVVHEHKHYSEDVNEHTGGQHKLVEYVA